MRDARAMLRSFSRCRTLRLLETERGFAREQCRQALWDRQWRCRRSMILTATFAIAVLSGPTPIADLLHVVSIGIAP